MQYWLQVCSTSSALAADIEHWLQRSSTGCRDPALALEIQNCLDAALTEDATLPKDEALAGDAALVIDAALNTDAALATKMQHWLSKG